MPKNTYHCACGHIFTKSSTAECTGYRLPDYGPKHECFGCPYILVESDGWGNDRKVTGYECRAQKLRLPTARKEKLHRSWNESTVAVDWTGAAGSTALAFYRIKGGSLPRQHCLRVFSAKTVSH